MKVSASLPKQNIICSAEYLGNNEKFLNFMKLSRNLIEKFWYNGAPSSTVFSMMHSKSPVENFAGKINETNSKLSNSFSEIVQNRSNFR